jgi:ribosomal protein S27E
MAVTHPQLAADFDLEKNDGLCPESLMAGTAKKIWWKCRDCSHEWRISGSHRTKNGCPGCAHKVVTPKNCMAVTHPTLSSEFHPIKNGNLTPFDFIAGSPKKVWWLCSWCGGEWLATCSNRRSGKGCPTCANGGFNQSLPGVLYVLCGNTYGKIGISNQRSLAARLTHHRQKGLFGPLVAQFDFVVGSDALRVETKVKRLLRQHFVKPDLPEGFTEAFPAESLDMVLGWVNEAL